MESKRGLPKHLDHVHEAKRFRENSSNLLFTNQVSAQRIHSLMSDAQQAGADHVDDLASCSNKQNVARDLKRKLLKGHGWPRPYEGKVRTWDPKAQEEVESLLPFMLPSELLATLVSHGCVDTLRSRVNLDATTKGHAKKVEREWQMEAGSLVVMGLWCDGIVTGWDRSGSLEVFSVYFPGLPVPYCNYRFPVTAILKDYVMKGITLDDICQIIVEDAVNLSIGQWMPQRLDKRAWQAGDGDRKRKVGKSLGACGCIALIVPDWAMLKTLCRFPQHNEKKGFCYKCDVTPASYKDLGQDGPWRQKEHRMTHFQCLERMLRDGVGIAAIMGLPGLDIIAVFRLDWMHVMDGGVSADFLGILFHTLLGHMSGTTLASKVGSLFKLVQKWYKSFPGVLDARLDNLTVGMIYPERKTTKSPKLNGQCAEIRSLISFAPYAASIFFWTKAMSLSS